MEKFSPAMRTRLRTSLQLRDRPLTIWVLIAANRWRYAIFLSTSCVGICILYSIELPTFASLIGGLVAGALLRDIGWFRQQIIGWPLTCAIIDWDRVEQLLNSEDETDHPSDVE